MSNQGAKRLALFQFTDNVILDICAKGVLDGLKKSGVLEREKIAVDHKMAHGEFPTAQSIAQEMVSKNYDYIVTVSTVSLQVTANHNRKIPHVFAAVTDPIKAGVAKSFTDHPPNLTGLATPQPVEPTVRLMRRVFPKAKVIGMIWNPAEVNSEICTVMTREAAKKYGFKVVEVQITGTQEIDQALRSILASEPDIFFTRVTRRFRGHPLRRPEAPAEKDPLRDEHTGRHRFRGFHVPRRGLLRRGAQAPNSPSGHQGRETRRDAHRLLRAGTAHTQPLPGKGIRHKHSRRPRQKSCAGGEITMIKIVDYHKTFNAGT
jgi:hypothetical protein